jgi:hypothetical protein
MKEKTEIEARAKHQGTILAYILVDDYQAGIVYKDKRGLDYPLSYVFNYPQKAKASSGGLPVRGSDLSKLGDALANLEKRLTELIQEQVTIKTKKGKGEQPEAENYPVTFKVEVMHTHKGLVGHDDFIEAKDFLLLRDAKKYREEKGEYWKKQGYTFEGTSYRDLTSDEEILIQILVIQKDPVEKSGSYYANLSSDYFYMKEKVANA